MSTYIIKRNPTTAKSTNSLKRSKNNVSLKKPAYVVNNDQQESQKIGLNTSGSS